MDSLESKIIPGLYFAGEVLNIDGITGEAVCLFLFLCEGFIILYFQVVIIFNLLGQPGISRV
jgi:hypothetical protein